MIVGLLKELFVGLGRYLKYHARKLVEVEKATAGLHGPSAEASPTPPQILDVGLLPRLVESTVWPTHRSDIPPAELASDPLYQLWLSTKGGYKWSHYFPIYRELFESMRTKPLRILEIGVANGAGLRLWRTYFEHPDTVVVGLDINPRCRENQETSKSIHVRIGDQTDSAFLQHVVREFGPFDLIIDDGSHRSSHIITTFNELYLDGLKDVGLYLVEDLHANYWEGWADNRRTFLDICRELVEHMHAQYRKAGPRDFFKKPSDQPIPSLDVPLVTTWIREIRFFDSIVAIYKRRREFIPYYLQM